MTFILGPSQPAYSFLKEVPSRFELRNGVIVVAWARRSGVGLLYSALGESLRNVDVVVGMANRGTSAEALALLRSISRRVFVYHKHHLQTFHPKVYLFDDGQSPPSDAVLLVGSSNLTGGGLYQNIEGNLALELRPSDLEADRTTYDSVVQEVAGLQVSPFCEQLMDASESDSFWKIAISQLRQHWRRSVAETTAKLPDGVYADSDPRLLLLLFLTLRCRRCL